jgi:chaperonin cofactor prefoldin
MSTLEKILSYTKAVVLLKDKVEELQKRVSGLAETAESHERRIGHLEAFLQFATDGRYLPRP